MSRPVLGRQVGGPALEVRGLSINYQTGQGTLQALREVSLTVPTGKITGIVGESGCGKSTLISAIIRLLAPNAHIAGGTVQFQGDDLLQLSPEQMRALRGDKISMVFQDPMTSLNPVLTIGRQMSDVQHRSKSRQAEKNARSLHMLEKVGIADPKEQLHRYPHHLSGGMRQRVAIAMALMAEPALLIADEPTTALDATLEVQIIKRLRELQRDFGCSVLFISHHLGVIAELCDEVVVMYAGEVVESGPMQQVFSAPRHPYTQKLLDCDPARIEQKTRQLPVIEGNLPQLVDLPPGCIFQDRCTQSLPRCSKERPRLLNRLAVSSPSPTQVSPNTVHLSACHLLEEQP